MSQTSEQAPIVAAPAGVGRRLGALLYDVLLIIALWMITTLAVVIARGEVFTGLPMQLLFFAEVVVFYAYFWARGGQTLGMRAWRLQLVNAEGRRPSPKAIFKRMCIGPLSLVCVGLGYVWYFVGTRQQTWHDRYSETYVVLLPKT